MAHSTINNSIVLITLLFINYLQINHAFVVQKNEAVPTPTKRKHIINTSVQMSAVENSFTADEINSRLAAQLEKLKLKDATSLDLKKEVCIMIVV